MRAAAKRARPLIEAIQRYEVDNGVPPVSLDALVPNYIKRIPRTGHLRGSPDFEYDVFTDSRSSLVWYDLGSRNGQPRGLWVYIDGDPDHAILVFTQDQSNMVVNAYVDRMPESYEAMGFDLDRWNLRTNRIEMVRSLPEHYKLTGVPLSDVEKILGPPDGNRELRNTPWELRIPCTGGFMNWDVFLYWPTGKYPEHTHGGSTEIIGDWCYVHE